MYPRVLFHTPSWLACGEQPLCKTHIAGRVSCSGQIISLRRFDKVSVEEKPHNVQNFNLTLKSKKFRSSRWEFEPSFIVKLLFITALQARGNKVYFSNLVICSLSILVSCQIYKFSQPWNIKGHFPESCGLRASVSSSPSPSPNHFFLFPL